MTGRRDDDLRHVDAIEPPDLRWVLAGERTLLAWFRLALALFLLGLALLALVPPGVATLPVSLVAGVLMLGCAAAAVTGVRRWHRRQE